MAIDKIGLDNQFECRYPAPIDPRHYADTLAELITRDTSNFFDKMVVFVKEDTTYYYKVAGVVGDQLGHWVDLLTASGGTTRFLPYDNGNAYIIGETAAVGSAMFICVVATTAGEDPYSTPSKWLQVASNSYTAQTFTNQISLSIAHTSLDPIVQVWWYKDASNHVLVEPSIDNSASNTVVIEFSEAISGKVVIK